MTKPLTVKALEAFGRERLSRTFFMRDFLHSDISQIHGIPNVPDDPDLAIQAGRRLCQELLEPLQNHFGRLAIRSAFRAAAVNDFGNKHGLNCASNEKNAADHIWDLRDANGHMGATACIIVPWFADRYSQPGDWQRLAWWIHDHLPYASMCFFPKFWAFNLQWHEKPVRRIDSYTQPQGCLTKPGMPNHGGSHADMYIGLPKFDPALCLSEAVQSP
ncbi:hypothetical protein [Roseococcus microcysteis]|uniref:hypothetical protein n=1 Tax=Roseococcus microcysteis TaxID=2771361 RepID=UPI00168BBE32|nr:hypothetical protein [Roseococcus microcysteis]